MALTPGGGRSPSTQPPPAPPPAGPGRQSPDQRPRGPTRQVWVSTLRFGVLIGGLVIISDLLTHLLVQRWAGPDDLFGVGVSNQIADWVLYSVLGIVMARSTGLIYSGALAGLLAGLLDAIVVAAATTLAPLPIPNPATTEEWFVENVASGALFTAVSCVVYILIQRWSAGQRPR